jgi:RimJ/RimL family protein N-acetyltransferase
MTELQNSWIQLHFLTAAHKETLRQLAKDQRIWEYTKTLLLTDSYDEQFDKYFGEALATANAGGQAYAILDAGTGSVIGMTRVYDIDPRVKKATIGHTWYSPAVWGRIHNKACKLLLLEYLFETLALERVEFRVAGQNIRSQKAVLKIGATAEGVLRRYSMRNDGTPADTHYFSILGSEWPEKKPQLQQLVASLA